MVSYPQYVWSNCVHMWDMWVMGVQLFKTLMTPSNECSQSDCLRALTLDDKEGDFCESTTQQLQQLVPPCSLKKKKGRKWKELHPSVQVWVREMAGKLMWRRVCERASERKQRMSSFIWGSGWKKAGTDSIDDVYSWGGKDGRYGGVKGPPVWVCVCADSVLAACMLTLRPFTNRKESYICHIAITPQIDW